MPLTKRPALIDNLANYTEGYLDSTNYEDPQISQPIPSPFVRMVVLDVVFDPYNDLLDETKKAYWHSLGVLNNEWENTLPRNSIIAKLIGGEENRPMFVFPFFPSHLSLPCKPGEFVWVMLEDGSNLSIGGLRAYWFCRVTEPHVVDDVNHTHAPRAFEPTLNLSAKDIANNLETIHELRNGVAYGKERITAGESIPLPEDGEDIFERLVTESDASKLMSYESIPRYRKRPGDIAIEGTNNTLLVLGTDRLDAAAKYRKSTAKEDIVRRTSIGEFPEGDFKTDAGSIDLVVGRGQTNQTYGKSASTKSLVKDSKNSSKEIKKELNKTQSELTPQEGDLDLLNDRSRIRISQRSKIDRNLGINTYNQQFSDPKVEDSDQGDSSILIKSDKIRIVAREDLQMIVTNYKEEQSPSGRTVKRDSDNLDEWAAITIKKNGDIVFTPSSKGYIRLGSDDADRAILCTDKPAILSEGTASFSPGLFTTGASTVGTGAPGQGTFSKKVLVK